MGGWAVYLYASHLHWRAASVTIYILNDSIRTALLGFGKALAFSIVIYRSSGGWIGGIEEGLYKGSIYGRVLGRATLLGAVLNYGNTAEFGVDGSIRSREYIS